MMYHTCHIIIALYVDFIDSFTAFYALSCGVKRITMCGNFYLMKITIICDARFEKFDKRNFTRRHEKKERNFPHYDYGEFVKGTHVIYR